MVIISAIGIGCSAIALVSMLLLGYAVFMYSYGWGNINYAVKYFMVICSILKYQIVYSFLSVIWGIDIGTVLSIWGYNVNPVPVIGNISV